MLTELIREDVPSIGCVVMSGCNTTLYTVRGTEITQHINIDVDLPSKHGRGGQSMLRFERLAKEARHNYISKVIEIILRIYSPDLPLIVGGSASLKDKMVQRLSAISNAPKVLRITDIQYDKKRGLYELLNKCQDLPELLQVAEERKWISVFMNSIAINDRLTVYGEKSVMFCLLNGMIKTLILHVDMMTDDIAIICANFNTKLVLITSILPEANQLKIGFGGKVGLLHFPTERMDFSDEESEEIFTI